MTFFDDQAPDSFKQPEVPGREDPQDSLPAQDDPSPAGVPGDPFPYPSGEFSAEIPIPPDQRLPEDLRIPWSWSHFTLFLLFGLVSFVVTQLAAAIYLATQVSGRRLSPPELQQFLSSKPQIAIGANLLLFGLIFLFLYVTIAVLHNRPFWRSLGWRKLGWAAPVPPAPRSPWIFFFGGSALAIGVAIVSSTMHTPENLPIQELFKNRTGAILLMCMAVFVAPLVEETVFRGYLYPLFARTFGTLTGIGLTGLLFGLMHGWQLGWTYGLVLMLILVGVIFTYVRARTGTVFASFLMHLGYNSMIAVSTIIATHGFTHMPIKP